MSWEPMDEEELRVKAESLLTAEVPDPVIEQFVPTRAVLWRQWRGTILEETWPATLLNMGVALGVCMTCQRLQAFFPRLSEQLHKIVIIWKIHMTLTTFILTFFVSQSYDMWRSVYKATRHVQGRLYNLLMLTTTHLRRERPTCVEGSETAFSAFAAGSGWEARATDGADLEGLQGVVGAAGASGVAGGSEGREPKKCGEVPGGVLAKGAGADAPGEGSGTAGGARGVGGIEAAFSPIPSPRLRPPSSAATRSACCGSRVSDNTSRVGHHAACGPGNGSILTDARMWLAHFERYTRLWQILYYAGCSRKHACFCTDPGLERLHRCGLVTQAELTLLKGFAGPVAHRHMPVFQWMIAFYLQGLEDNRFLQPVSLTTRVMEQFVALRDKYGGIGDMVGGRTKLAYAHAVQLLVDCFLLLTPFALFSEVGFWSVFATGVLTTFYQGLFNLSKTFIDPLNNEDATIDSDCIVIDSLVKESANFGRRWTSGAVAFPF
eukprot:g10395.t1